MVNKKGFGLIEVMIAAGIVSVVILGMLSVTKSVVDVGATRDLHANADAMANSISQSLRFRTTCVETLRNGVGPIPYDISQATSQAGMPIAITIKGLRAGAAYSNDTISGLDNSVTVGTAPTFAGSATDLPIFGLEVVRVAFRETVTSGTTHFGYIYLDLQVPAQKSVLGGNALKRKMLGGVVIEVSGGNITDCYGNSPDANLATICTNLGCTYSGTSCTCAKREFTCNPGELFWKVAGGEPICKELGGGDCPAGQYVSGVGLGRVICSVVPDRVIASSGPVWGALAIPPGSDPACAGRENQPCLVSELTMRCQAAGVLYECN